MHFNFMHTQSTRKFENKSLTHSVIVLHHNGIFCEIFLGNQLGYFNRITIVFKSNYFRKQKYHKQTCTNFLLPV